MAAKQELSAKVADILMVVDSGEDRNSLVEILVNDGYKPRQFEDSQLALEAAFAQPPSLILLDVKILGMSSYEFCQSLKKDERTRDVPIIFAGKLDELQDCIHKFEIMGIDFICKPLHEAEVLLRVKNHLRLREVQFHLKELVAERTAELQRLLHEHSLELSSAREQIRVFFESSPLGLALTNFAGQFLEVNKSLADMLRTTEASLLQRNASDVYVDPRQRVQLLNQLREKGRLQDFTVHILRDDGNTFYARLNSSRLVIQGEELFLAMVDDVSEQIAAEQKAAVQEERERLARELHDSVSQILFSAGMIADATLGLWDKDPALGQQNLEILSRMIRGASAEMRSLLLEMRPDTLRDQTLAVLLETLAVSARARSQAEVSLKVNGDRQFADEVTLALHRIAQESLNNVAKHAEASEVLIELSGRPNGILLSIRDDGRGFDPQVIPSGHLGIGIMRERAQKIGATLQIDSEPGDGTAVIVSWEEARGGE
ncbi:MAG: PAS domain S-box protein [Chloroflexi bacterium]|jgi:PAS domain S-box-containing protein|nr:PAS domain S-box protein [Chloroflexota bacterium]